MSGPATNPSCRVENPRAKALPLLASQYAGLRNLPAEPSDLAGGILMSAPSGGGGLIALDFETMEKLSPGHRAGLAQIVRNGATLYVRGGFSPGQRCSLAPLAPTKFEVSQTCEACAYRFTAQSLVPAVLEGERFEGKFALPGANVFGAAEPIALATSDDGVERPFIFAVGWGAGIVICDLLPDEPLGDRDMPIVWRLADAASRPHEVGALIAVNRASGIDPKRRLAFNLSVDDRPANFDHLCARALRKFLEHAKDRFPGVHIDFAWTPSVTHPSAASVSAMIRFKAGFLWHGFRRHVDHRGLFDFQAELDAGRRLVQGIERRFGISFQRIMIFPYERATIEAIRCLRRAGFVASAEYPDARPEGEEPLPGYMRYSTPLQALYPGELAVLRRYPAAVLSRGRMLAQAALGMPIMAAAHPKDLGLRRLPRLRENGGGPSYFDHVLEFAAAKGLRARPMEETAREVTG